MDKPNSSALTDETVKLPVAETISQRQRLKLIIIIGALSAFGPLSIDMYLPGLPDLSNELNGPAWQVQLTLTACVLGLAGGQVLAGPISDAVGRKRPLLIGLLAFAVASLLCALTPNVPILIGLRILQGMAGSAGIVIARAMVRDLYQGAEAARFFALTMIVNGLAPILAPLAGGQILNFTSWRGVFVVLTIIGLILLAAAAWGLQETLPVERRRSGGVSATLANYRTLLANRNFICYSVAAGLAFAAMLSYISGSPFVLEDIHHLSPQLFSLVFAVNAFGIILTSQISSRLVGKVAPRRLMGTGLAISLAGSWLFLLVTIGDIGLSGILPGFFLVVASIGLIAPNSTALAMAEQGSIAGTAAGFIGVMQYLIGAAATPFAGIGGSTTALPLALVMATVSTVALLVFAISRRA